MKPNETTSYVTVAFAQNPGICGGEPTIAGTRITVKNIMTCYHSLGWSEERIVEEYPHLTIEEVRAALNYKTAKVGGGA